MSQSTLRKSCKKQLLLNGSPLSATSIPLVYQSCYEYDSSKCNLKKSSGQPSMSGQQLVVNQEALCLLRSIKKPVAVLAICGPYRSGKSYFLSQLLSVIEQSPERTTFNVGSTMDACTHGIWMATSTIDCDDFEIILLDTEGIGAARPGVPDTTCLLIMTVLLSSYLIYNSRTVPTQDDLYQMRQFSELSLQIVSGEKCEEEDLRHMFPKFLWLFRDVYLDIPEEYSSMTDYLLKAILVRSSNPTATQNDGIVRALTCLFPSIEGLTLKSPPHGQNPMKCESEDLKTFHAEMNKAIVQIINNTEVKKPFDDHSDVKVNGSVMAVQIEEYASQINASDTINLKDTWKVIIDARIAEMKKERKQLYISEMKEKLEGKLPLEEEDNTCSEEQCTLLSIHLDVEKRVCKELEKEVKHLCCFDTESYQDEVVQRFRSKLATIDRTKSGIQGSCIEGGILKIFAEENLKASKEQCKQTFIVVHHTLHKRVDTAFEELPMFTLKKFREEVLLLKEDYEMKARGPARSSVYEQEARAEIENKYKGKLPANPVSNIATAVDCNHSLSITWVNADNEDIVVKHYEVMIFYENKHYDEKTQGDECTFLLSKHKVHGKHKCSVKVRAVSPFGKGEWSTEVSVDIPARVPNKPSKPTVTVLSHSHSKLDFDMPCSEYLNGSEVACVIVTTEETTYNSSWKDTYKISETRNGIELYKDRLNDTKKKFRIQLKTNLGTSEASDAYHSTDDDMQVCIIIDSKVSKLKEKKKQKYKKLMEDKLKYPLEEGKATCSEEQCTLLSIHSTTQNTVCDEMKAELLDLCPMLESDQQMIIDKLISELAIFDETKSEGSCVKGGILKIFAGENFQASQEQCQQIIRAFYEPLLRKFHQAFRISPLFTLSAFDGEVQKFMEEYEKAAKGPARSKCKDKAKADISKIHREELPPNPVSNIATAVDCDHSLSITWINADNKCIVVKHYEVMIIYENKHYDEKTQGDECTFLLPKHKVHGKHKCSVKVRAVSHSGDGEWSEEFPVDIPARVPNKPSKPTVTVLSLSHSIVNYTIPCSEYLNGSKVSCVIIKEVTSNTCWQHPYSSSATEDREFMIAMDNLNDTKRKFTIQLVTNLGTSEASDAYHSTDDDMQVCKIIDAKVSELKEKKKQKYKMLMECILNDKLPLEEGKATCSEGQCTLLSIHSTTQNIVCDEMKPELLDLCPMLESDWQMIIDKLISELAIFDETKSEGSCVKGGILKNFAGENFQASQEQCQQIIRAFYEPLLRKFHQAFRISPLFTLSAFDGEVQKFMEEYEKTAKGPARSKCKDKAKADISKIHREELPPNPVSNIATVVNCDYSLSITWINADNKCIVVKHYEVMIIYENKHYDEKTQGDECTFPLSKHKVHGKHKCSVKVRAVSHSGDGEWSEEFPVDIPARVPNKPSKPTVTVLSLSHSILKVNYTIPCSEYLNGSEVLCVIIEEATSNTCWQHPYSSSATEDGEFMIAMDNLNDTKREFTIRLETDRGTSEASDTYSLAEVDLQVCTSIDAEVTELEEKKKQKYQMLMEEKLEDRLPLKECTLRSYHLKNQTSVCDEMIEELRSICPLLENDKIIEKLKSELDGTKSEDSCTKEGTLKKFLERNLDSSEREYTEKVSLLKKKYKELIVNELKKGEFSYSISKKECPLLNIHIEAQTAVCDELMTLHYLCTMQEKDRQDAIEQFKSQLATFSDDKCRVTGGILLEMAGKDLPCPHAIEVRKGHDWISLRWNMSSECYVMYYSVRMKKTYKCVEEKEIIKCKEPKYKICKLASDCRYTIHIVAYNANRNPGPAGECKTETKYSKAARRATSLAAGVLSGVGAAAATPIVPILLAGGLINDAATSKKGKGKAVAATATLPLTIPASAIAAPVAGPVVGTVVGKEVYSDMDSDKDFSDSDN